MPLRRLDELCGAPVIHRLLAGGTAAWPGSGGEDYGVAALHRPPDGSLYLLFLEVHQHGLRAVRPDVRHLFFLAYQPPHLVAVLREHPDQTPRRLAVRPSYEHLHGRPPFFIEIAPSPKRTHTLGAAWTPNTL